MRLESVQSWPFVIDHISNHDHSEVAISALRADIVTTMAINTYNTAQISFHVYAAVFILSAVLETDSSVYRDVSFC